MIKYRIKKSPSGEHYRIQYQKETLFSRFIRLFLPEYPRQYRWQFVLTCYDCLANYPTENSARIVIDEMKKRDIDKISEKWSDIEV